MGGAGVASVRNKRVDLEFGRCLVYGHLCCLARGTDDVMSSRFGHK